jgi:bifunctional UDP-N-acetylglucosamine pyrophosphorylase/glucosamine-1-phosphate N-acetyltransferase
MQTQPFLTVVLAAGLGTRMRSAEPKVMHRIAGRSMLGHVLAAATAAGGSPVAVVVGPQMPTVRAEVERLAPNAIVFEQTVPHGTAHAVLAARAALENHNGDVLVIFADTPLITAPTLQRLVKSLDNGVSIALLGFEAVDPWGYGRLILDRAGYLTAICEEKDASEDERRLSFCNSGVMAFRVPNLADLLGRITNTNAKGEFYLTDAVAIARSDGLTATAIACPEEEVLGVNAREQLATAEQIFQHRARKRAMQEGATLIAPETVWFSYDTIIGRDVVVEPNVFFGPGVTVEDNVEIKANCYFQGARIGKGSRVGPFVHLRPGADIGENVHLGNFVEVKNARFEKSAKANHLAYIGDGRVGERSNIGAGTIFCNYDGFNKHFTDVGREVFIGSNSALIAPVHIGDGAYVAAGSVITKDVKSDALAIVRPEHQERVGWAARFRARMNKQKKTAR